MRRSVAVAVLLVSALRMEPAADAQSAPAEPSLPVPRVAAMGDVVVPGLPQPQVGDLPLPINLATALRLADARPIVIEAARAALETQYGLLQQARVLWLPTIYAGVNYQRHDGGQENLLTGAPIIGPRNQFMGGAGAAAVFALTDAIYSPLAARQIVQARNLDIQTAKNDALLAVFQGRYASAERSAAAALTG